MNQITLDEVYEQTKRNYEAKTTEQKLEDKMRFIRGIRKNYLEESDKYMSQIDRYNTEQILELKTYRQQLRDLPITYNDISKLEEIVNFPQKPSFITTQEIPNI